MGSLRPHRSPGTVDGKDCNHWAHDELIAASIDGRQPPRGLLNCESASAPGGYPVHNRTTGRQGPRLLRHAVDWSGAETKKRETLCCPWALRSPVWGQKTTVVPIVHRTVRLYWENKRGLAHTVLTGQQERLADYPNERHPCSQKERLRFVIVDTFRRSSGYRRTDDE